MTHGHFGEVLQLGETSFGLETLIAETLLTLRPVIRIHRGFRSSAEFRWPGALWSCLDSDATLKKIGPPTRVSPSQFCGVFGFNVHLKFSWADAFGCWWLQLGQTHSFNHSFRFEPEAGTGASGQPGLNVLRVLTWCHPLRPR